MIWQMIEDWFRGILTDGILSNLSGLFDSVNTEVGEIATQVGTTPAGWNAGIFNMIRSLSENVIVPMEASAIREGFSNLKDGRGYDNLYQSALCRAKADWLIGINATRLFSILYHKTLNVGRVQTPTLAMLVNRDYAISSFKKEKYHVVRLDVGGVAALSERQDDEAAARQMKAACEKSQAVCTSLKKEKKTAAPPKLFDLTALQREANRLYGFTAKQTLDYAQALYEKRLLTYPRTDSKYITSDMEGSTKELITGLCAALPFILCFFDFRYLPCCCGYNPYAFIAHTVQQRVKLPPPGGFLRIAVREEKLIYRNMIPGYKVIEYL